MKRTCLLWIVLCCCALCEAQQLDDAALRREQLEFLKHDTLPVEVTSLPSDINTPYSEYNGVLLSDSTFYFSSLRPESADDYENIFEEFWATRIYSCKLTSVGYSRPVPLSRSVNDDHYYNCNFTFNADASMMIFTRCMRDGGAQLQCTLWKSERKGSMWTKPQQLNKRINLPGTTTTQPHWVDYPDYSVMYFASDRPRGFGDMDIWYTIYQNNHFDDPVNAGSIVNSADNEVSPFYDTLTNRLFFSCDAPDRVVGGYDIFYAEGSLSQWSSPVNIGVPFNSTANDIYFTVNQNKREGFFASNRPKNPEDDADTCCTDLYHYRWLKVEDTVPPVTEAVIDTLSVTERVEVLLPITLYFHNDEPDPRTTATTTKRNYRSTLADYLALKETYKEEYAKGLKGESAVQARQRIEQFFTDSVEMGYAKLQSFTDLLLSDLQAGNSVEITVCGFASPLHKADYNLALSSRRICSFVNYLKAYQEGVFLPYLSDNAKVSLTIIAEPEGSSMAKKEVSDNLNDKRNSVYSIAASKERRIQITRYTVVQK